MYPINTEELEAVLKISKNRKTPGLHGVNMELIKYAPKEFRNRFLDFINICWKFAHKTGDGKTALVIPSFKKGVAETVTLTEGHSPQLCLSIICQNYY
jgi:hypothetical protein